MNRLAAVAAVLGVLGAVTVLVVLPRSRGGPDRDTVRARRLSGFALENASAPAGTIVFLGSSTIELWPLDTGFPGKPCLNRGIGSESAREIRERLDRSLPKRTPAAIVVYAGSADFRAHGLAPAEVATEVAALLDALRERLPGTPIVLLGVLPDRDATPADRAALDATNQALEDVASSRSIPRVDTDVAPLRTPDGRLDPRYAVDRFHLNAEGYRELRRLLLQAGGDVAALLRP